MICDEPLPVVDDLLILLFMASHKIMVIIDCRVRSSKARDPTRIAARLMVGSCVGLFVALTVTKDASMVDTGASIKFGDDVPQMRLLPVHECRL